MIRLSAAVVSRSLNLMAYVPFPEYAAGRACHRKETWNPLQGFPARRPQSAILHRLDLPAFPGAGQAVAFTRFDFPRFLDVEIGDRCAHAHCFGLQPGIELEEYGAGDRALQRRRRN